MLKRRVITSVWTFLLVILAVWFDKPLPWFTVLMVVWALLALYEFYRMSGVIRAWPLASFGLLWAFLFMVHPHFDYALSLPLLLISALMLSLILLVFMPRTKASFGGWTWMVAGILYIGLLASYLVALRLEAGRAWVYLALLVTFGSDTCAFFVGRALGRHHLAPAVSPGKTWEGAGGGLLGAVAVSLLFTLPTPAQLPLGYVQIVLLGLAVSVFGQFGDLVESLIKRSTGAKESGTLMPGHGGVLDRMDSVLFAGVVVYLYYTLVFL